MECSTVDDNDLPWHIAAPYESPADMSCLLETSAGDIVIDLLVDEAPKSCENFLKLCKLKYYNFAPVYNVQPNFAFQSGDPIGPGSKDSDGGSSIWGLLPDVARKTFKPEFPPKRKHVERGTVSMATVPSPNDPDDRRAGSQFIVTLGENTEKLDETAAIFGMVLEGFDVLEKISTSFLDIDTGRPLKDIRILHTHVLEDPFPDPPSLSRLVPESSPEPSAVQLATVRIAWDEELADEEDHEKMEKLRREREARAQALTLEMVGDLPFAEVKPPENVLFVCKMNPVTRDEDLELIFSRFGKILSCEIIRDKRTGDSLQYAFIEFDDQKSCEEAYKKMDNVLIDDHRIHVDFSQSVSKLSNLWRDSANAKRGRRGGFGGIDSLEKKSHYRADGDDIRSGRTYNMVFDKRDSRRRNVEPDRDRNRDGDRDGDRDRKRDRDRDHGRSNRDRHRDRSRSPPRRHREEQRYHDDRYREGRRYREERGYSDERRR